MYTIRTLFLGTSVAALTVRGLPAQQRQPEQTALVGVTVIDPASPRPPLRDQTVIIAGARITMVGPRGTTRIPAGARLIMASGKFVIPELWDAHVHFMNTGVTALPLLVAMGVTSVREMGGYIDSTRAWQSRMRDGKLVGPRILTPGPVLESPRYIQGVRDRSVRDPRLALRILPYRIAVADSSSARQAIDSLVKLRVDFVKVRTTASPEAWFGILRAAHRAGLKVAAHQATVDSLTAAADSGQDDL
ncbi:MAG TPA: hypothetical protein VHM24_01005, partial [Gemmatimonadaceae bacterium]|nr:hypothetical protein [Gemmatimonadaceae bacterium]